MPFIVLPEIKKERVARKQVIKKAFLVARAAFLKDNKRSKYTPLIMMDVTPLAGSEEVVISVYDENTKYSSVLEIQGRKKDDIEFSFYLLDKFCKNELVQELVKQGLYISSYYDRSSIAKDEILHPGYNLLISRIKNFKKEEKHWSVKEVKNQAKLFKKSGLEYLEEEIIDIVYSIDYSLFKNNYVNDGMYEIGDYNKTFTSGAAISVLNVNELTDMFIEYLEKNPKNVIVS